jgi:NAD(P)-dependent dehydrogenase (short-subunit alcohol dehydrogenase family)
LRQPNRDLNPGLRSVLDLTGDRLSFEGQVAIITGAGRGIGRAHALEFGKRGASVLVNDIDSDAAAAVVKEITAAGGRAAASEESVATPEGGQRIVDTALAEFGDVHAVVNNAGTIRAGFFHELTWEDIRDQLDTHLIGAMTVTQPAWRVMMQNGYGRVIMTSSTSGMVAHGGLSNYAAAKAGVYGLMKSLASEGLDYGIQVNAVLPLAATTIGANNTVPYVEKYFGDVYLGGVMAGRRDPSLITNMVCFLASRECQITGEAYSVAGGRYARVFVGFADGWVQAQLSNIDAEAVREHIDEIRDTSGFSIPNWAQDELGDVGKRVEALLGD